MEGMKQSHSGVEHGPMPLAAEAVSPSGTGTPGLKCEDTALPVLLAQTQGPQGTTKLSP